jgi:hypothetical protein
MEPRFSVWKQKTPLPILCPTPIRPTLTEEPIKRYHRTWRRCEVEKLYALTKDLIKQLDKPIEELALSDVLGISEKLGKTPEQCLGKLSEVQKSGTLRAGVWSVEEDSLLESLIKAEKLRWGQIAATLNAEIHRSVNVRTGKQCKERWNNHLNPHINRGRWEASEELFLLELYQAQGNRWCVISKELPTRTESNIKNKIKSLLNKEKQDLLTLDDPAQTIARLIEKKRMQAGKCLTLHRSASPPSGARTH